MNILISGSIAYDRIMDFPGKFSDHILPDKIHILNVCFIINNLRENFGGTAGNIAYTLSLLGESPRIIATAGRDFGPYREWLKKNRLSSEHILIIEDELTACAYITTDQSDNQITAFNPGAMKYPAKFNFDNVPPSDTIAIISPGNLEDMYNFTEIYKKRNIPYIFDPGQSLPAWDGDSLIKMIDGSWIFISNDYELQLTMEKTGIEFEGILERVGIVITTKGEFGSLVTKKSERGVEVSEIPAFKPNSVKDPTGAGDAYRGGLIKGLVIGKSIEEAAKLGSACASYCVSVYGTQTFSFNMDEVEDRLEEAKRAHKNIRH